MAQFVEAEERSVPGAFGQGFLGFQAQGCWSPEDGPTWFVRGNGKAYDSYAGPENRNGQEAILKVLAGRVLEYTPPDE